MIHTLVPRLTIVALLALAVIGLTIQLGSADDEIEDQKLEAFINAALAVDNVMDKWQPRIIQEKETNKAEALHSQANAEIKQTIEQAQGISYDEYQEIRRVIASDPNMLERVTAIMWQQQSGGN